MTSILIKEARYLSTESLFTRLSFIGIKAQYGSYPGKKWGLKNYVVAFNEQGKKIFEGAADRFKGFAFIELEKYKKPNRLEDFILDGSWKGGAIALNTRTCIKKLRDLTDKEIKDCVNKKLIVIESRLNILKGLEVFEYAVVDRRTFVRLRQDQCIGRKL